MEAWPMRLIGVFGMRTEPQSTQLRVSCRSGGFNRLHVRDSCVFCVEGRVDQMVKKGVINENAIYGEYPQNFFFRISTRC